ncbi:MAG: OmpA family protein [Candidatus Solibacter usitatus]|nr:OmpA family protein [Candidatus Solibacter usitatus]
MKLLLTFVLALLPAFAQFLERDAENCAESKLITRMTGCLIHSCERKEFDSAELQMKKDDGVEGKAMEGQIENVVFMCPVKMSQLQIVRNAENALKKAGFSTVTRFGNGEYHHLTMQKGAQWLGISTDAFGEFPAYTQTAILVKEMQQEMEANAEAFGSEIDKSGRVAIYGIQFDTGKATIKAESAMVLAEIAKLLKSRADLRIRIEGHTDNVGAKAANMTLSSQRAASVMAWLVANGIDKARLTVQGFGDSVPAGDNTTEEGRAKNRRVELAKI